MVWHSASGKVAKTGHETNKSNSNSNKNNHDKVTGILPRPNLAESIIILKNYFLFASLLLTINNRNKNINDSIDMLNISRKERR